jgi:hypothetical protein
MPESLAATFSGIAWFVPGGWAETLSAGINNDAMVAAKIIIK